MGNRFICMNKKEAKENNNGSRSKRMGRSQRKMLAEEEFLHRQALSMALQQHQLSQRFEGSMSRRIGGNTSSRRRTLSESLSNGKQVKVLFWIFLMILLCLFVSFVYQWICDESGVQIWWLRFCLSCEMEVELLFNNNRLMFVFVTFWWWLNKSEAEKVWEVIDFAFSFRFIAYFGRKKGSKHIKVKMVPQRYNQMGSINFS